MIYTGYIGSAHGYLPSPEVQIGSDSHENVKVYPRLEQEVNQLGNAQVMHENGSPSSEEARHNPLQPQDEVLKRVC